MDKQPVSKMENNKIEKWNVCFVNINCCTKTGRGLLNVLELLNKDTQLKIFNIF